MQVKRHFKNLLRFYYGNARNDFFLAARMGFESFNEVRHQVFACKGFPLVYLRNCKAGSVAVIKALNSVARPFIEGTRPNTPEPTPLLFDQIDLGKQEYLAHETLNPKWSMSDYFESPDYKTFSFVRDPYARALTGFFRAANPETISMQEQKFLRTDILYNDFGFNRYSPTAKDLKIYLEFIDYMHDSRPFYQIDVHYRKQVHNTRQPHLPLDHIARIENFSDEILNLFRGVGLETTGLELDVMANSSKSEETYSHLWSRQNRELAVQAYREDFETFGYDK